MLSARPFAARLASRLFGHRDVRAAGGDAVVLAPASDIETGRAYYLPGELDRIEAFIDSSNPAQQLGWLHPGPVHHKATRGWRVRDAIVSRNAIYRGRAFTTYARPELVLRGRCEAIAEAQFCGGQGGNIWFGHWLYEELSTELLAADRGLLPLALASTTYAHEAGYRALTGLHAHKPPLARVRSLWLVDDQDHNRAHVARLRRLRALVRRVEPYPGCARVYVGRGTGGTSRTLVNEPAIKDMLAARGFTVIEPEGMAPEAIARTLAGARLMVTVEGSALIHGLVALPEGAAMVAIMPPRRFNSNVKVNAQLVGLRFGFTVAETAGAGFSIDPDRLLRTLDLIPDL